MLVEVKAAGVVPNLRNVVTSYPKRFPFLPLPALPAIYGFDSAGVVAQVGSQVRADIKPGDRVYVNPGLSCGSCLACRRGDHINCTAYTFQGYFGFGPGSQQLFEDYPYGGFGQYLTAPAANLVKLPDSISFEQGARFGYLGTAYSALRKAQFSPGQTVLIDGATGTLGLGAVILGLARGAARIFATGRNTTLIEKLQQLEPQRIVPIALGSRPTSEIVMDATGSFGVDALIEALGGPQRRGGDGARLVQRSAPRREGDQHRRRCRSHTAGAIPPDVPAEVLHRLPMVYDRRRAGHGGDRPRGHAEFRGVRARTLFA